MRLLGKLYEKLSNAWYQMHLKNDNFTILTNTCIAGVMYHKLGKRFMSPTINLWMYDEDFYKFVHNMDYYLAQPLQFVKSEFNFPTALCGDVKIYFNHYKTEKEAANKWYERRARINRDNLFIIVSDGPNTRKITHEDMLSLKDIPCIGKVVFTIRDYDDMDYLVHLPKDPNGEYVNDYMLDKNVKLNRWRWEDAFDWVHWLNTGEVKLKK